MKDTSQKDKTAELLIEDTIKKIYPSIADVLKNFGKMTLKAYARASYQNTASPIQSRDDLISEIFLNFKNNSKYTIHQMKDIINQFPVIQTTNHQGISCNYFDIQGNLLFSLPSIQKNKHEHPPVLPVFSCGSISFDSLTNPKGFSLSRKIKREISTTETKEVPLKISLFPAKYNHSIVSHAHSFDRSMVLKAKKQVALYYKNKNINDIEYQSIQKILNEYCLNLKTLRCKYFNTQTNIINSFLWRDLFIRPLQEEIPLTLYFELEKTANQLIKKDLKNKRSLFYQILFSKELRADILDKLDRTDMITGCWSNQHLISMLETRFASSKTNRSFKQCGSHFFWGIDQKRRRFPLYLKRGTYKDSLIGFDHLNHYYEIEFHPDALIELLEKAKILPTIFSCFAVICFARAIRCIGGYHQAIYLPLIQTGIKEALMQQNNNQWAEAISEIETRSYFGGLFSILADYKAYLSPAGTLEIIARGGLNEKDLETLGNLKVEQAALLGMPDAYREHFKKESQNNKAFQSFEKNIYQTVKDDIKIIQMGAIP